MSFWAHDAPDLYLRHRRVHSNAAPGSLSCCTAPRRASSRPSRAGACPSASWASRRMAYAAGFNGAAPRRAGGSGHKNKAWRSAGRRWPACAHEAEAATLPARTRPAATLTVAADGTRRTCRPTRTHRHCPPATRTRTAPRYDSMPPSLAVPSPFVAVVVVVIVVIILISPPFFVLYFACARPNPSP